MNGPLYEQTQVVGWAEIARFTPFSASTVQQKYGKEMLKIGVVFKSRIGRGKRPTVWGWPTMIMAYFREKSRRGEL